MASNLNLLNPSFGVPSDVTFTILEGQGPGVLGEVQAHKIILALKSKVFKKMFFTPGEKQETAVMETSVEAFQKMLDHIYDKKESWTSASLVEVFQVAFMAVKFEVEGLMEKVCTNFCFSSSLILFR